MKYLFIALMFCFQSPFVFSQLEYSKWFTDSSLRIDYIIAGNNTSSEIYLQALKKEAFWGGSKTGLIDNFGYGRYYMKVFPGQSDSLIYSRGFASLFQEWQTTKEAEIIKKGFFQTAIIPYPKVPVRFEIYERNEKSDFVLKLSVNIDPSDYFIEPVAESKYKVENIRVKGDPSHSVDLVFIPEGYTKDQMGKFKEDILRLTDTLFQSAPFSKYIEKFNLYAVIAPSEEEGADIPGAGIWKNTVVSSSFYTFDSERYLTTLDYWKVKDLSGLAPCDQVYILVNTKKYGGGAVYNYYNLTAAGTELSPVVFVHEFGHGFAGLGDEYYTSDVSYSDFYSPKVEPWEPNLTTLINFQDKWKDMLSPGTPVPTPPTANYINSPGVFEGGGYVATGVYRPAFDCRMKSNTAEGFCKVCQLSIEKMILFLTE